MFSKIRRFLNEKCAIIVYKTMLMPFYDYCDIVYMYSNANELHKLDRHHIRGMNICVNKNREFSEEELYVKCKVSKLEVRRKVHLRNFMFKNKNKCIVNENNINTRLHDGPVFKDTHPNSEPIERSVMYGGANEWNNLDADIRSIEDLVKFKRIQKSWMLNTYLD